MSRSSRRFAGLSASLSASITVPLLALALGACGNKGPNEPRYTIVKPSDVPPPSGGISPDKEAEIQLVMQQREVSTRRCYQDVLNVKQDRNFAGSVKVIISLNTDGTARDVRVAGGTLTDPEVQSCLVDTIKRFEFPQLPQPGDVQQEFQFRPAY